MRAFASIIVAISLVMAYVLAQVISDTLSLRSPASVPGRRGSTPVLTVQGHNGGARLTRHTWKQFYRHELPVAPRLNLRACRAGAARARGENWTIHGLETITSQVKVIRRNLIIDSDGVLKVINSTLKINCTYDGEFCIIVRPGGELILLNSSITSVYPSYSFSLFVEPGAHLEMVNSNIIGCGSKFNPGFVIRSCDVKIIGGNIMNCHNGIMLLDVGGGKSVNIMKMSIAYNTGIGIACYNTSDMWIGDVHISSCEGGGIFIAGGSRGIAICSSEVKENGEFGIYITCASNDISVNETTVEENEGFGVVINASSHVHLIDDTISFNGAHGVYCLSCHYVSIRNCSITENYGYGVMLSRCEEATIAYNSFMGDSLFVEGDSITHYEHHVRENRVNGRRLVYALRPTRYSSISESAGELILVDARDVTVSSIMITQADIGLLIAFSRNVDVSSVMLQEMGIGIWCYRAQVSLTSVLASDCQDAIVCHNCSTIRISGCELRPELVHGVIAEGCGTVETNSSWIYGATMGLLHSECSEVMVHRCVFSDNWYAIVCDRCAWFNVYDNEIVSNVHGLYVISSEGNINMNNIRSNEGFGLIGLGDSRINATYNWWGDITGPEVKLECEPEDPEEIFGDPREMAQPITFVPYLMAPLDRRPPTVEFMGLENGAYIRGVVDVRISATDDVCITLVEIYVDDELEGRFSEEPFSFTWNTTAYEDGPHYIRARAYDSAGNVADRIINVFVDNTAPQINIVDICPERPTENYPVNITVVIKEEGSGLAEVEFYVDGVGIPPITRKENRGEVEFVVEVPEKLNKAGERKFLVVAIDMAGNRAEYPCTYTVEGGGIPPWAWVGAGAVGAIAVAVYLRRRSV